MIVTMAGNWWSKLQDEHGVPGARAGAWSSPAVLLHGAGVSALDELFIFGGIGLVLGVLIFLSWRAGRKNQRRRGKKRRSR